MKTASLIPGHIYMGGTSGNAGDDPISKLLNVGNACGIRSKKNKENELAYISLVTNPINQKNYPDFLDNETKILTYYGDQKTPGKHYLDTKQKGNLNLENLFKTSYYQKNAKLHLFPCFYFEKIGKKGRNYLYHGIAYPYVSQKEFHEVCNIAQITSDNGIINNLKFSFTVNSDEEVSRQWLLSLTRDSSDIELAPNSWKLFLKNRFNQTSLT